jgi:hypothetical protein
MRELHAKDKERLYKEILNKVNAPAAETKQPRKHRFFTFLNKNEDI